MILDLLHYAVKQAEALGANDAEAYAADSSGSEVFIENNDLKQQLAAARSDAKRLNEKIDGAKERLEGLLSRLPG